MTFFFCFRAKVLRSVGELVPTVIASAETEASVLSMRVCVYDKRWKVESEFEYCVD